MVESRDTDKQVGQHRPVLINCEKWLEADRPDLFVVRCTRHYKGLNTDEILGTFKWDEWEESAYSFNMEMARIVSEVIQDKSWGNLDELSTLYSEALKIMAEDKRRPYVYVMMFKGSWLTEVHHNAR